MRAGFLPMDSRFWSQFINQMRSCITLAVILGFN